MRTSIALPIFCLGLLQVTALKRDTLDSLTNLCIDSTSHKTTPSREASLYKQCSPWKERSCCTENTTRIAHESTTDLYNIDFGHCAPLSKKCKEHFVQDICFYECSPNTGPWLIEKPNNKYVTEKANNAPLCESDCTNWYNDCKYDLTCVENWGEDFNWTTGVSTCPTNSQCKTFEDIYGSAAKFCSKVWNYSWKMVPDSEPCIHMWFDSSKGNPNDAVALQHAKKILNAGSIFGTSPMVAMAVSILYLFSS
ncbi:hypothetical protein LOTGIDRAFT_218859 [Lottia gigantea]|uniref:Folate receptor-like domain-containing protein n=1 Tax=Lottia gigantea TaxID=225164 RepID=V3ZYM9_LOTGI|nr:hypothetical protein LOTGIDRAFT_218859 [Lottia gigantea]ESO89492.1 hypothetical protein LOTGIDRAFT_218859 [Lottia gigantea]